MSRSKYDAFGLFTIVRDEAADHAQAWSVHVLGYPLATGLTYGRALNITADLVQRTTMLDGDAKCLAIAWAHAAEAQLNLTDVQQKCTELTMSSRDLARKYAHAEAKLNVARAFLYRVKFEAEQEAQGVLMGMKADVKRVLDETREDRE